MTNEQAIADFIANYGDLPFADAAEVTPDLTYISFGTTRGLAVQSGNGPYVIRCDHNMPCKGFEWPAIRECGWVAELGNLARDLAEDA